MQTNYTNNVDEGLDGQVATAYPQGKITGLPTVPVTAGRLVTTATGGSTTDQSVRPPTAAGDVNRPAASGLVILEHTSQTGFERPADRPVGVLRKGQMYVRVESAVTRGTNAYVRHTAAGAEVLGALRGDDDGGDATLCTGIVFLQSRGAGEICIVEVNL